MRNNRLSKLYFALSFLLILILLLIIFFYSNKTLTYIFKEKVWAHRVNSIEKFSAAKKYFSGVELDVVYYSEKNYFDVNHPPEKSNNLSLVEFFKTHPNSIKYWLDFKNLSEQDTLLASNTLDSITDLFMINKKNVVVESPNLKFLISFQNKGFLTSFYLPVELHALNEDNLSDKIKEIRNNILNYESTYISTDFKDYPIIKEYFPKQKKIIWFVTYNSYNKFAARVLLYKILLDEKVDVLLIPFNPKVKNKKCE